MISEEKLNKIDKVADELALQWLSSHSTLPLDGAGYRALVAALKLMAITFAYEEERNE